MVSIERRNECIHAKRIISPLLREIISPLLRENKHMRDVKKRNENIQIVQRIKSQQRTIK